MKSELNLAVATALGPLLSQFQEIGQLPLRSVWRVGDHANSERFILDFGVRSLIVSAVPDDDTVDFDLAIETNLDKAIAVEISELSPWHDFVGKSFGWGWITVNQQGYCDGLLLSFEGVIPQIVLNVIASSIKIGTIGDIPRQ